MSFKKLTVPEVHAKIIDFAVEFERDGVWCSTLNEYLAQRLCTYFTDGLFIKAP